MESPQEQWARNLMERLQRSNDEAAERREYLAAATVVLARGIADLGANGWAARPDSKMAELDDLPPLDLGQRQETAARIVAYEASINLYSAGDQLQGFAFLLMAQRSLMGAVSISRGVFEACIWASALIDPSVSAEVRLQRALTRRLARLAAGIRLEVQLSSDDDSPIDEPPPDDDEDDEDEHGSRRDPQEDIDHILALARDRGWRLGEGRRSWWIGSPLSIDWLVENLERRVGVEQYAWSSGSSMAHGEHAADTASWLDLTHYGEMAPAWLIRTWSTGAWAGPRLFLDLLHVATRQGHLVAEWSEFNDAFWDVEVKKGDPVPPWPGEDAHSLET